MNSPISWSSDEIFRQFDRILDEVTGVGWGCSSQSLEVVGRVPAGVQSDYDSKVREDIHIGTIRHLCAQHVRPCENKYLTKGDQER